MTHSVAVIGAGLVGLATAYKLLLARPEQRVVLLEKESGVARHQSSHNSGVLHAGLHYAPGSRKARLAPAGLAEMISFCRDNGVRHEQCGKVVIATHASEIRGLHALADRGTRNGLRGLRLLTPPQLRELEPHAAGIAGLHVPEEGIVDYSAVAAALRRLIEERGGIVMLDAPVTAIHQRSDGWALDAGRASVFARVIVNAAGLHSDRVAALAGEAPEVRIVPFRGEYWTIVPERTHLVRNLIYPVPDPTFPFLGVHFTRMIGGGVEAGPNAVLAMAREGYSWTQISPRDLATSLTFRGLWRFLAKYPRIATYEVARSFSKSLFVRSLQRLVPEIRSADLVRGPSGVRAQAMKRDGTLVDDFELIVRPNAVHILNAPSPAATASLAIGGEVARIVADAGQ